MGISLLLSSPAPPSLLKEPSRDPPTPDSPSSIRDLLFRSARDLLSCTATKLCDAIHVMQVGVRTVLVSPLGVLWVLSLPLPPVFPPTYVPVPLASPPPSIVSTDKAPQHDVVLNIVPS